MFVPGVSRLDSCMRTDGNTRFRVSSISMKVLCNSGMICVVRERAGDMTDLWEAGTSDFIAS